MSESSPDLLDQHGHPFSTGSDCLDLATKFVQFFGDGFDLMAHQTRNDQSAQRPDDRPESRCGLLAEIAIQISGHYVETAFRAVLKHICTEQFQTMDLVQMRICLSDSHG